MRKKLIIDSIRKCPTKFHAFSYTKRVLIIWYSLASVPSNLCKLKNPIKPAKVTSNTFPLKKQVRKSNPHDFQPVCVIWSHKLVVVVHWGITKEQMLHKNMQPCPFLCHTFETDSLCTIYLHIFYYWHHFVQVHLTLQPLTN